MESSLKVKSLGSQLCYSWTDEHGFHQYYCERLNFINHSGKITDFKKQVMEKSLIYSWNDELGFHSYHLEK